VHPYEVLVKPLLSEKSNRAREKENKYSFHVNLKATKEEVKKAVEKTFDVKVLSVRTTITRVKVKRRGNTPYKGSNVKKAVVSLVEGAKIPLFEDL
jgi:large subunit ribosomal protein L23